MKKLNWGWRIALLYGGFVVFILIMVFKTTTVHDDLVTPDYYAKELQYQQKLDKQNRANQLKQKPTWQISGKQIAIQFPGEQAAKNVKAEILFYNTAEAKKDFKITCTTDTAGLCAIDAQKLQHGVYQMQIDWSAGGVTYYNEGFINIQ